MESFATKLMYARMSALQNLNVLLVETFSRPYNLIRNIKSQLAAAAAEKENLKRFLRNWSTAKAWFSKRLLKISMVCSQKESTSSYGTILFHRSQKERPVLDHVFN